MNTIGHISHDFSVQELSEDEVLAVSGGHPLIIAAGIAAAGVGIYTAGATIGKSLGKALYYLLND
jgi:lactobin A/cerein 7B family class IIb bacteriocin